ncbi:MAG TPA: GntR family transcriptional regulator [Terracidiphilus sp.]
MGRLRKGAATLEPPPSADPETRVPKHRRIFEYLHAGILSGKLAPGDRLPSEGELGLIFDASRITVAKALLELRKLNLVVRRPGAGTYVLSQQEASRSFGLLIPELGKTEIFETICHGMMRSPAALQDVLLWGNASASTNDIATQAEQMAQSFIAQNVSGVFFAPLESIAEKDAANRRIARVLELAGIPIVLLDRCYLPYPERSAHDLVAVDNRRAGYVATSHLIGLGAKRLAFLGEKSAANTIDARVTGFYEALRLHHIVPEGACVWRGSAMDEQMIRRLLDEARPEGIVCGNDLGAARLMQTLLSFGVRIPEDVRIVGMDDVKYASLLPVPLTTIRQDCSGIGVIAMATMLQRLEHPDLPIRDILIPTRLIVRRSCGAYLQQHHEQA